MDKALIIESTNWAWVAISGIAGWRTVVWIMRDKLTEFTGQVAVSFAWIFMASALNPMWFALSRTLAPVGETWNPAMLEWRWLAVLCTWAMFAWGITSFIRLIEGLTVYDQLFMTLGAAVVAIGIGMY